MESNIFGLQCEFIEYWDHIFNKNYEGKPKKERLVFFRALNQEVSHFYYRHIDYNIWKLNRAYFFAFWFGIFYLKNSDCIREIERILKLSNIYYPFSKICKMLNNKVVRIVLHGGDNESRIIFDKMNEFKNYYSLFKKKVDVIVNFLNYQRRKMMLGKIVSIIPILRKKLPDEIVLHVVDCL